jgi:hypothetical protein
MNANISKNLNLSKTGGGESPESAAGFGGWRSR